MSGPIKLIIFWGAFLTLVPLGILLCARSEKARQNAIMALILGTMQPSSSVTAINFLSLEWYRGTTRGVEICYLDWLTLIILFSTRLRRNKPAKLFWPVGFAPMLAYAGYCLFTLATQDPKIFGVFELSKILRGILVYFTLANAVQGEDEARLVGRALAIALIYEGYLAITQRYLGGRNRVPGSFDHSNSLSMYLIISGSVVIATAMSNERLTLRVMSGIAGLLALIGVILTQSRTGFVTILVVSLGVLAACGMFRPTLRNMAALFVVLAVGGGVVAKSWKTISSRMAENAQEVTGDKTEGRAYYFNLATLIVKDMPMGCGLNNWSYWVTNRYGGKLGMEYNPYRSFDGPPDQEIPYGSQDLAQAAPGHSLVALTVGELGWPGLALFGAVWLGWFLIAGSFLFRRSPGLVSRLGLGIFFGLLGCFYQSQTEWEFRQTSPFFLMHILMGTTAGLQRVCKRARIAEMEQLLGEEGSLRIEEETT